MDLFAIVRYRAACWLVKVNCWRHFNQTDVANKDDEMSRIESRSLHLSISPSEVISLVQLNFVGPGISPRRLARDFRSMRLVQQRAEPEIEPVPVSRKSIDLVVGKFLVFGGSEAVFLLCTCIL